MFNNRTIKRLEEMLDSAVDGTFVENISANAIIQGTYKVNGKNISFNYITINEKKNYKYDPETKTIKMMINETMGVILSK